MYILACRLREVQGLRTNIHSLLAPRGRFDPFGADSQYDIRQSFHKLLSYQQSFVNI